MGSSTVDPHSFIHKVVAKDVIFDHIAPHLLAEKIIDSEEYEKIKIKNTDPERIYILLEILSEKKLEVFDKFVNVLGNDYKWIAEKLKNNFHLLKSSSKKSSQLSIGITPEMIKLVQKNYRAADKWTSLAHSLGMTRHIMDIRIKVNMYGESNSMCVVYLLQEWVGISSRDATLGRLITILREQEFNDVADELEEKFS